jgi:8-oxo-dGTP diphosphatase
MWVWDGCDPVWWVRNRMNGWYTPVPDYMGGHVDYGERVEKAVMREAKEETGLDVKVVKLTGVYSDPKRDPRGHTVGVAYLCEAKGKKPKAGDDASEAWWWPLDDLPELAFDHKVIVGDAVRQLG